MDPRKLKKAVIIILLVTAVLLTGYSFLFRTLFDSDQYLQIAWDYTNRDPHILNWQEPFFEIVNRDGRFLIHFIMHTDQDDLHGPYSIYIDPFKKKVVDEDPRH